MRHRAGLNTAEKRKFSYPRRELIPGCPDRSPSLYRLKYSGFWTLDKYQNKISRTFESALLISRTGESNNKL
jgi:hypothetical protein